MRLDDENFEVVGVMPATFNFPKAMELWTPYAPSPKLRKSRTASAVVAIGLLQSGTTVAQARAELNTIAARLEREYPQSSKNNKNRRFPGRFGAAVLIGDYSNQYVRMLFVASLFVLLIACANVANLYLRAHRDAAAGLATWVPARRATRVDPLAALREE